MRIKTSVKGMLAGGDAKGEMVKHDPIAYPFLWRESPSTAVLIMAVLASVLAAPAGVIGGGFLAKRGRASE